MLFFYYALYTKEVKNMFYVDISRLKIAPKVPTKPPITPARSKQALMTSRDRDPVQVYCRIRPLDVPSDDSCVTVLSDTVVQVVPPETSQGYRSGTTKVS